MGKGEQAGSKKPLGLLPTGYSSGKRLRLPYFQEFVRQRSQMDAERNESGIRRIIAGSSQDHRRMVIRDLNAID